MLLCSSSFSGLKGLLLPRLSYKVQTTGSTDCDWEDVQLPWVEAPVLLPWQSIWFSSFWRRAPFLARIVDSLYVKLFLEFYLSSLSYCVFGAGEIPLWPKLFGSALERVEQILALIDSSRSFILLNILENRKLYGLQVDLPFPSQPVIPTAELIQGN